MSKATATADPDLAMTEADIDAILADARAEAEQAAAAAQAAEAALRGETPPDSSARSAEVTPARLAELRAAAEHAALKVTAAERRVEQLRAKRTRAEWEAIRAQIREQAADDLNAAEHLVAKVDAFETALTTLCEALQAHNDRIDRWRHMMGSTGIGPSHNETAGPEGFAYSPEGDSVTVGAKTYRPLTAGKVVGAIVHRAMKAYPRPFIEYGGFPIAERDWIEGLGGPVDVRERIRRDA